MAEPQALTSEQAGYLQMLLLITSNAMPLNLSGTRSIDFRKVVSYESVERTETKKVKGEDVEVGTGEFVPIVFLQGGDTIELTPEENEIFRSRWAAYGRAADQLFAMVDFTFPRSSPDSAIAPDAVQEGGVQ